MPGGVLAAIGGFFTSIITSVAGIFSTAAGAVFLVILWKSDSLPVVLGWVGTGLEGFFRVVVAGFGFLGDLLAAVF